MNNSKSIDIVDNASYDEFHALRGTLEYFGYTINRFPIGRPQHLVDVLSSKVGTAPYLIIAGHGDNRGFLLDELAEEIARQESFHRVLSAEQLITFVQLPGRVVISTGCNTGTAEMANAFLKGGASAYIAPNDYPEWTASHMFLTHLFYLLTIGSSLEIAVEKASSHDNETRMFQLFSGK